jgi:hypothetical protein
VRKRFHDLVADGEDRVEAGHRVLEDHADAGAADGAHRVFGDAGEVLPLEHHAAAPDFGGGHGQEADQRHHGHRFAGAGFAHNPKEFAGFEGEAHVIDGMNLAPSCAENGLEVLDVKDKGRGPVGHRQMLPYLLVRRLLSMPGRLQSMVTLT